MYTTATHDSGVLRLLVAMAHYRKRGLPSAQNKRII